MGSDESTCPMTSPDPLIFLFPMLLFHGAVSASSRGKEDGKEPHNSYCDKESFMCRLVKGGMKFGMDKRLMDMAERR